MGSQVPIGSPQRGPRGGMDCAGRRWAGSRRAGNVGSPGRLAKLVGHLGLEGVGLEADKLGYAKGRWASVQGPLNPDSGLGRGRTGLSAKATELWAGHREASPKTGEKEGSNDRAIEAVDGRRESRILSGKTRMEGRILVQDDRASIQEGGELGLNVRDSQYQATSMGESGSIELLLGAEDRGAVEGDHTEAAVQSERCEGSVNTKERLSLRETSERYVTRPYNSRGKELVPFSSSLNSNGLKLSEPKELEGKEGGDEEGGDVCPLAIIPVEEASVFLVEKDFEVRGSRLREEA